MDSQGCASGGWGRVGGINLFGRSLELHVEQDLVRQARDAAADGGNGVAQFSAARDLDATDSRCGVIGGGYDLDAEIVARAVCERGGGRDEGFGRSENDSRR